MISHVLSKDELISHLDDKQTQFINFLETQDIDAWEVGPADKWTLGQQGLHIVKSMAPVNTILSLPKFYLKLKYKKADRAVRPYNAIVKDFHYRVENDPKTARQFSKNMRPPKQRDRKYVLNSLQVESKKLQYKIGKWSDAHLDSIALPHSLLGDIPIRELLMWTIHHIEHHYIELETHYKQLSTVDV